MRRSSGREAAKQTDAEAQGQGNASQKAGRITSASAGEDMQADIVREVTYNTNINTDKRVLPSAHLPEEEEQKLPEGEWLQVKETSHTETVQGDLP